MRTDIIAKNGSILGKIPRKTNTMSRNTDRVYYSSSSSESFRGYIGRSPRASPATMSRSREELSASPRATSSRRPDMSEAIAEYRSRAIPVRLVARVTIQHREPQHREHREQREHREHRAMPLEIRVSSSSRPPHRTTSHRPSRSASPAYDSSSSESSSRLRSPVRRRNPADFSSEDSDSTSSRASLSWSTAASVRSARSSRSSHLAPVARDFLQRRKRDGEDEDYRLEAAEGESFFPTPKVTFMIDEPQNLKCQICLTATLAMAESDAEFSADTTAPAILPCGHVACENCLGSWLMAHHSCPFCRLEMRHAGCGHTVEPRLITSDTIHELPRTTAEGGTIGRKCRDCRVEDSQAEALEHWEKLAEDLRRARREAREQGTGEAKQALKRAEKAFENAPSRAMLDKVTHVDASW